MEGGPTGCDNRPVTVRGPGLQGNELCRPRRIAVIAPTAQRVVVNREVGGFKEHSTQMPIEVLRLAGLLAIVITEGLATDAPTIGDSSETLWTAEEKNPR